MNLAHWARARDTAYVARRLLTLGTRYGLTPRRAQLRAVECVSVLNANGCAPTFATPGRVVAREGEFCAELAGMGAEFAIHGFDHVDFRGLSRKQVVDQLVRAAHAYDRSGIAFEGFRCPYLSWTPGLLEAMPDRRLRYSSNTAIWWNVVPVNDSDTVFRHLWRFYQPLAAETTVATPRLRGELVEIPASLPDDLQLVDGLRLGEEGLRRAWSEILRLTHRRGDLFAPLFHPELFGSCRSTFEDVLRDAATLRPRVWVTQLRDVGRWWRERAAFTAEWATDGDRLRVRFACSPRGTILAKNVELDAPTHSWDGAYAVVEGRELTLEAGQRPFVGVAPSAPATTVEFLREHGYVVDTSSEATRCSIYLDEAALAQLGNEVALVEAIEASSAPLVKFGRWPDETRSALCVAGDLDALTLGDYAARFLH